MQFQNNNIPLLQERNQTLIFDIVDNKKTTPKKHFHAESIFYAAFLPLLITGSVIFYENNKSINEPIHFAAPLNHEEFEDLSIDASISEQRSSRLLICPLLCDEEEMKMHKSIIRMQYCVNSCGYTFENKIHMAAPVEMENERSEVNEGSEGNTNTDKTLETSKQEKNLKTPHTQFGVYLTASSVSNENKLNDTIRNLRQNGANAIIFDIKGSYVYFQSYAAIANEIGTVHPLFELKSIVNKLHENGIYAIGRYIVAKDTSLASRIPETQIKNIYTKKGLGTVWVSPNHEETLAYNEEILREVFMSGIDEVNFDYIRYPTEYDQRNIGLTGEQKADRLVDFLSMARNLADDINKETKIGVSTYAILGWNFPVNFEPLGQDISRFSKYVDIISPMAYPSTFAYGHYYNPQNNPGPREYYLVKRTLDGYKDLLKEDAWKLRPWIQGYFMDVNDIGHEIRAVTDAGLCGFTVWNAGNNYGELYKALAEYKVPQGCL